MNPLPLPLLGLLLAALATGCGERSESVAANGVLQTKAPGHASAGGQTSGAVMAAAGQRAMADPAPSGTPGTPQGMEGNTGGTAMGGTSASRKEVADQPAAPPAPAPAPAASAAGATAADRQKELLADSMDAVAAHWRARAAGQGWPTHPPTPVAQEAGIQASAEPTSKPPAMPIRSEKLGTAPPSEDVKTPGNAPTDLSIGRQAPDAATAK